MDDQWPSSRIVSVKTNRELNKHKARSVNLLIKTKIGSGQAVEWQLERHHFYDAC